MKRPKPQIPKGAPAGTVWFGGPIDWFVLRVSVTSVDLVPAEVTALLGCSPDSDRQKGKPLLREDGTIRAVPKFGHWSVELRPADTDEWDCGEAIMELFHRLPSSVELWRELARKYRVAATFALSMRSSNKGFELSPELLQYMGDRGISAEFDIYVESEGEQG